MLKPRPTRVKSPVETLLDETHAAFYAEHGVTASRVTVSKEYAEEAQAILSFRAMVSHLPEVKVEVGDAGPEGFRWEK